MGSNESSVLSNAERQARFKSNLAFRGLPKDVQVNILCVSNMRVGNVEPDPELVAAEIGRRTQAALRYQGMYPDGCKVQDGVNLD